MDGGLLIREARRRRGLTQRELAQRLGTSHAAVARWEKGVVRPSWEVVLAAVREAGFDLRVALVEADDHDLVLARERLSRSPRQRLSDLAALAAFIERGRKAVVDARNR